MKMVDMLISGGTVATINKERSIIKDGAVAIENNKIIEVGKTTDLEKKYSADTRIEAKGRLVLPGFVNVHTHTQTSTTRCRGIAWETPRGLYTRMMPIKEHTPNEDRYYLGMASLIADLRMGITCEGDQDFGEASIAKAVKEIGIRGVLSQYIRSVDFQETKEKGYKIFHPEVEKKTLDSALEFIREWDDSAEGRIKCDLAPHATDTCTPELLAMVREEANKRGKRVTIHLAQSVAEVREIKDKYGKSPFEYLRDTEILGPDCYAAHCIYHTGQDIKILAETDTKVCHCAWGMHLEGGTAPLIPWLEAGVTVGLGLDCRVDMIRNMRHTMGVAAYRKSWLGQGHRPNAQKVLDLATIEGAKVLGMEKEIGSLEQGKRADVILVDMRKGHLTPSLDPVANLVYFANGNDVETVIVDGNIVVENGKVLTVNVLDILPHVQEAGERAWDKFYGN